MESSKGIASSNFGLSSKGGHDFFSTSEDERFDHWFWESKSKKKLKENQKKAEIERMRAETAAMKQLLSEQDNAPSAGINVSKIALIGGAVILLGIGAVVLLKKKNKGAAPPEKPTAEDLTL